MRLGEKRSVATYILDAHSALNSASALSKKMIISLDMLTIFVWLISAKHSSNARLKNLGNIKKNHCILTVILFNGNIRVFQTFHNGGPMPLHGLEVDANRLQQGIQCHITNILVRVEQETAENVYCQHTQATLTREKITFIFSIMDSIL
jgi:hypothetical protein